MPCIKVAYRNLAVHISLNPIAVGRLPFDLKIGNFRNEDKWYGNFLGKVPENLEIVEFPKSEHSTENSGNSGMKVKWNGNLQEKIFENLGIPHEVVLFSRISVNYQFSVLLAAITSSWTSHATMTVTHI